MSKVGTSSSSEQPVNQSGIPTKMEGIITKGYSFDDPTSTIEYKFDLDTPQDKVKDNEVLVQLKYCSLNPVDYKINQGVVKYFMSLKFPAVLGKDGSGVVVKKGSKVTRFNVGDEVLGFKGKGVGSFAQFCVYDENELSKKPGFIEFDKAASIPLVTSTVLDCFQKALNYKNKKDHFFERVLIVGASGGTGSYGVFVAKHYLKAKKLYAVCSTDNVEYVKSLGADRVIDYKKEDFVKVMNEEKEANKVDGPAATFVLDCVGGYDMMDKAISLMDSSSIFTTIAAPEDLEKNPGIKSILGMASTLGWKKLKSTVGNHPETHFVVCTPDGKRLEKLFESIEKDEEAKKVLQSIPLTNLKLNQMKEAFEKQITHRTVGKIVLEVPQPNDKQ